MSIKYVGIRVTELERSLRFYREGLGLKELARGKMSHGGTYVGLEDPESHFELELNVYPADSVYATKYVVGEGLDHLGLEVADARATIERLRTMGAKVALEPWLEEGRYWIGFVEDPDGIWVEIQSRVRPAPSAGAISAPSGPS
ncbi:MAG: VOC family protein [Thermoplasmata archaeon]